MPGHLQRVVDVEVLARAPGRRCPGRCPSSGRRRPVATSTSSPRSSPSSVVSTTSPPSRRAAVTPVPSRTSTPGSRSDAATASPAAGSSAGQQPVAVLDERHLRTRARCHAVASSQPDDAAADDQQPAGHLLGAGRLARASTARRPGSPSIGGTAADEPVQTATACRAVSRVSVPSAAVTTTVRSPSSRPVPRTRSMPAPSTHLHLAGVVPVGGEAVAAGQRRGDVLLAGHRLRRAVDRAGLGEHLACRAAAPCSACTPSRSTRRRRARSPRGRRSARPGRRCRRRSPRSSRPRGRRRRRSAPLTVTRPSCRVVDWPPWRSTPRDFTTALRQYAAGRLPADRAGRHRRRRHDGHLGHERLGRPAAGRGRADRRRLSGRGARGGRPLRADGARRPARHRRQPVLLARPAQRPAPAGVGALDARAGSGAIVLDGGPAPPSTAGWTGWSPAGDHVLALLALEDVPVLNPDARPLLRLRGRYVDESGRPRRRP